MATTQQQPDRLAAWEWLRAGAALAVVLLHACVPYLQHPMPGLTWAVSDTPSRFVDVLGWTIEIFIMPLFLVMAGYFAVPLLRRLGSGPFLRHRGRRLLGPLVFGTVVVLPLDLYVFLLGWVVEGRIEPRKMRSLKFEGGVDRDLWGLSHLWFLHYLFVYCVVLVALDRGQRVLSSGPAWRRRISRRVPLPARAIAGVVRGALPAAGPACLAGGCAAVAWVTLALHPEVVYGFQHRFLPDPPKWIYSGAFFAAGVWLAIYDAPLRHAIAWAWTWLAVGSGSAVVALVLGIRYLSGADGDGAAPSPWLLSAATIVAAWGISMGLIGAASRHLTTAGAAVRYVASASLWTYLVHHPVVALLHIDAKVLLPASITPLKPLLVAAIAVGCCLLTFEVLVRRTRLGRWLGVRPEHANPADHAMGTISRAPKKHDRRAA